MKDTTKKTTELLRDIARPAFDAFSWSSMLERLGEDKDYRYRTIYTDNPKHINALKEALEAGWEPVVGTMDEFLEGGFVPKTKDEVAEKPDYITRVEPKLRYTEMLLRMPITAYEKHIAKKIHNEKVRYTRASGTKISEKPGSVDESYERELKF